MKQLFFLSLMALVVFGCKTPKNAQNGAQVISLKHGTSYGHCVGYCIREEFYTFGKVTYTQYSRDSSNYPPKELLREYTTADFNALMEAIDWQKWESLPETIGCPDCADGGAEYIEIVTAKGTKRVLFEARSKPEGMEKALEILWENKSSFEKAEEQSDE